MTRAPLLLDVSRIFQRRILGLHSTGIDRVGIEYAGHFLGRARAVLSLGPFSAVLPARISDRLLACLAQGRNIPVRLVIASVLQALLWGWLPLGRPDRLLLNVMHTGLEREGYAVLLRRRGVRLVTFIHDLLPLSHPEFFRPGETQRHETRLRCASRYSAAIIVNSEQTLHDLQVHAGRARLALPPAIVARLGPGLAPAPPSARPIEGPYFVVIGTIEPRKNHLLLLNVWRRLVETRGRDAPLLVLIGRRGWECEQVADILDRAGWARDWVRELGRCNDAEAARWLQHARAALFPSHAEGYGLPVLEALAVGVPVIASDLGVFREFAGDIPDYLDPLDSMAWLQAIEQYAAPASPRRAMQLQRIRQFRPASWHAHFREVEEILEALPENHGAGGGK